MSVMAAITHYHSFCFRIYRPVGSDMGHNNINTTRSMYPIIDHYKPKSVIRDFCEQNVR